MTQIHETPTPPDPARSWLHLASQVARVILGIAAILVFLASGLLCLLFLVLTSNPGREADVLIVKAILIAGWVAIGAWLLLDVLRGRLRGIVAGPAAWVWVYVVGALLGGIASLNWGP